MTERRYTEDEVTAIFERAAEAQQSARRQLPAGEGMSLAQLQDIGREVGIPSELVDQAARSLEREGQPASRKFLGLPIGVGRTIELGRKLTDAEWEHLVVDLRETFDAKGRVRYDGPFREWTNGNLQALLEPTPTGHRLRLRTTMGSARGMLTAGIGMVAAGAVVMMASVASGIPLADALGKMSGLLLVGATAFGMGAVRLPGWARLRSRQMEGVAARLALAGETEPAELPGDDGTRRIGG